MKEIKNVEQLAAALPELMKDTKDVAVTLPALLAKVEDKSNMRKEPPVPEAPVVKTASEPPVHNQEQAMKVQVEEKKIELDKELKEKKEDSIHNDAFKKEDDEIKEVEKQEILKKKEDLIEKLEETEERQKKILEEQKKILQDIKLEKEKLVIEKSEKKIEEQPQNIKDGRLRFENEVVEKESIDLVKSKNENTNISPESVIHEPKIDSNVNSKVKEDEKVVDSDIIKKNMADGVPLPLAVQIIMPQIEAAKSLRIVDNPGNPNEGNADSKVLRREILEEREKEQREKRDVQDVFYKQQKPEDVNNPNSDDSFEMSNSSVKTVNSLVLSNENVKTEFKKDLINDKIIQNNKTIVVPVENTKFQETDLSLKEEDNEHCEDKTKSENSKFSNELKPSQEVSNKKTLLSEVAYNTLNDVKSVREETKQEQTADPIIKTALYLSNPKIVLPDDKIHEEVLEGNIQRNEAKPMKRDLKSVDMTHKRNSKDSET